MNPARTTPLQQYLARRHWLEPLAWLLLTAFNWAANSAIVWIEIRRRHDSTALWEVLLWEGSSSLVWLALLPLVLAAWRRWPLHWGVLRTHGLRHLAASLVVSLAHVLLMVALRKAAYALKGWHYDFGHWPSELLYEALKDVRSYAGILLLASAYRLLLWRWQGEATVLQPDDDPPAAAPAPAPAPAAAPERLLVKKLGKEFLLPVAEIEWVQACGNYVNLRRREHDYPLRATLAAIEAQLQPDFVRVHRGWLVRLALVEAIEPTEAGDARLRLRSGATVPCSRSHLEALRRRLQPAAAAGA
jgi:hypothetical protein